MVTDAFPVLLSCYHQSYGKRTVQLAGNSSLIPGTLRVNGLSTGEEKIRFLDLTINEPYARASHLVWKVGDSMACKDLKFAIWILTS